MVQVNVRLTGLSDAILALGMAFPNDPKKKQRILHSAMGTAARRTILPMAQQLAKIGDGSGALSSSLGVRVMSKRKRASRRVAGGMELVPVRFKYDAIYDYIEHYYTSKGKTPPADIIASGIRHGHLVEFGSVHNTAKPFLWPAGQAQARAYTIQFAKILKKRIAANVKRAAKKRAKK